LDLFTPTEVIVAAIATAVIGIGYVVASGWRSRRRHKRKGR
jgi:hypothetical protein